MALVVGAVALFLLFWFVVAWAIGRPGAPGHVGRLVRWRNDRWRMARGWAVRARTWVWTGRW